MKFNIDWYRIRLKDRSIEACIVFFSPPRYLVIAGYLLFKDYCENVAEEPIPQLRFYEEVRVCPHTKLFKFASSVVARIAIPNSIRNFSFMHCRSRRTRSSNARKRGGNLPKRSTIISSWRSCWHTPMWVNSLVRQMSVSTSRITGIATFLRLPTFPVSERCDKKYTSIGSSEK